MNLTKTIALSGLLAVATIHPAHAEHVPVVVAVVRRVALVCFRLAEHGGVEDEKIAVGIEAQNQVSGQREVLAEGLDVDVAVDVDVVVVSRPSPENTRLILVRSPDPASPRDPRR